MIAVAAYCRVSTEKDDQKSSFEAQTSYFREHIAQNPEYRLYRVYADEGISGTSTRNRTAFLSMMEDARAGCFSLILTKEVSRFSRNILDTIACTRELKAAGVTVIFLNDGISTADPDSELRLSIMGSLAQEESRRTSARVKWGQTRQMEHGVVFGHSLLGYTVRNGSLSLEPKGAEIVKQIFLMYGVEKQSAAEICRRLNSAEHLTFTGNQSWSCTRVIRILKNEKYVGDLVQKKSYTPDYLSHKKAVNRGAESLAIIRNHHAPIVDRVLWETVQREIENRRKKHRNPQSTDSELIFSGKIFCGCCGSGFAARKKYRKDGTVSLYWRCAKAARNGADPSRNGCCIGRSVSDSVAINITDIAFQSLELCTEHLLYETAALAAKANLKTVLFETEKLLRQQSEAEKRKDRLLEAYLDGCISQADFKKMQEKTEAELRAASDHLKILSARKDKLPEQIELFYQKLTEQLQDAQRATALYARLLESITVFPNGEAALRIRGLSAEWRFQLTARKKPNILWVHEDTSVPISVSSPRNSGYGMA